MFITVVQVLVGLGLLTWGGEVLVRGAVQLALRLRMAPSVIGLTVVAAGTSMPELWTSLAASLAGNPDIAISNVIGSNIANMALVLGSCALFAVLPAYKKTLQVEWPFLFVVTLGTFGLMANSTIGRFEGLVMVLVLAAFLVVMVRLSRQEGARALAAQDVAEIEEAAAAAPHLGKAIALTVLGFVFLKFGADLLVTGAVSVALELGVSHRVIGLTLVALGTSLPELASSIVATVRGSTDVAVGNIIGSSIFNIIGILGVTAMVSPLPVAASFFKSDIWWLLAFTVVLVPVFYVGRRRVSRIDGAVLLAMYALWCVVGIPD